MARAQQDYEVAASALFIWLLTYDKDDGFDVRSAWNALVLKLLRLWGRDEDARALTAWLEGLPAHMQGADLAGSMQDLQVRFRHYFSNGITGRWRNILSGVPHCPNPASHPGRVWTEADFLLVSIIDTKPDAAQAGCEIKMDFTRVTWENALKWSSLGDNDNWCFSGLAPCNLVMEPSLNTECKGFRFEHSIFLGDTNIDSCPSVKQAHGGIWDGLSVNHCKAYGCFGIKAKGGQEESAAAVHLHHSVFMQDVKMEFNKVQNISIVGNCKFQGKCEISGHVQNCFAIRQSSFVSLALPRAAIGNIVDVVCSKFEGLVDLSGVRCGDGDRPSFNISRCQFKGPVSMMKMHVTEQHPDYAYIQHADFHDLADFSESYFAVRPMFKHVTFHRGACFDGMNIEQGLSCEDVRFLGKESSWQNMQVGKEMYIDDSEFSEPPNFNGTDLHQDSDFGGIVWSEYGGRMPRLMSFFKEVKYRENCDDGDASKKTIKTCMRAVLERMKRQLRDAWSYTVDDEAEAWPYKKRARVWESLAKQMEGKGRHDERHQFFRYTMFAKRMAQTEMGAVFALGNWLYWRTSNYGWSVVSPLVGWTITLAGAWMAFACTSDVGMMDAWRAALRDAMLLAPRSWECDVIAAGRGMDCGAWWRPVFKVLSVTFLFLFGLGIRNRFRLRT